VFSLFGTPKSDTYLLRRLKVNCFQEDGAVDSAFRFWVENDGRVKNLGQEVKIKENKKKKNRRQWNP